VVEEFSDGSRLGPAGMMAMESPVAIIEAYHLALVSTSLFLEHDRGAHLTAEAARAQDDPSRQLWIIERYPNDAFVTASRAWFFVEIVHI